MNQKILTDNLFDPDLIRGSLAVRKTLNHDVIQPRINSTRAPGTYLYAVPGYIGDTGDIKKLEAIRAKDKKAVRVST